MGEFEKRVKYVEDENANLGDPLRLPDRPPETEKKADGEPEKVGQLVSNEVFFLRPPKGIAANCEEKRVGMFLRYPGKKDSGFSALLLAVRESPDRAGFQKEVLEKLHASGSASLRQIERADGGTLEYDYYLTEMAGEPVRLFILRGAEPYRVAMGFQLSGDPSRAPRIEDPIRFSLGSLRLGQEAGAQRQAFKSTPAPAPGKAGRARGRG